VPRFHFNITDGDYRADPNGTELFDLAACRKEAAGFVAELLKHGRGDFWKTGELILDVTDERGDTLFRLYVGAVDGKARFH
jgi:hypothetical protein